MDHIELSDFKVDKNESQSNFMCGVSRLPDHNSNRWSLVFGVCNIFSLIRVYQCVKRSPILCYTALNVVKDVL